MEGAKLRGWAGPNALVSGDVPGARDGISCIQRMTLIRPERGASAVFQFIAALAVVRSVSNIIVVLGRYGFHCGVR